MSFRSILVTKRKIVLLCVLFCIVLLSVACQQTPDNEVIVNKGNSMLDERVLEKADQSDESSTEGRIVWNETKRVTTDVGGSTVSVNIDIETPQHPVNVPVYLIEPREFSVDFLKSVARYFMKDKIYDGEPSKQDIMMELLDLKKEVSTHTIIDQGEIESWLDFLNQRYEDAPDTNNEARFEFSTNDYGQNGFRIKSYHEDSILKLSCLADERDRCYVFYYRVEDINRCLRYLNKTSQNTEANGIETTYEQALKTANDAVTALFDAPYAMVDVRITDKINDVEFLWNSGEATSLGQAYVFCFAREYDGFPALYIDQASIVSTEKTEFAKPYVREYAQIVVDERGIIRMTCESFSETKEKLNDDVKLAPFEEVLERFKKDVFYHSLWGSSADINITKIEFGMVREPVKDNPNQYMMVPAWSFIGDIKTNWYEERGKSILALSAIDGSIITNYDTVCDPK